MAFFMFKFSNYYLWTYKTTTSCNTTC